MTRKKWNNLRRTRPELFSFLPPWEKMTHAEHLLLRPYSKAQATAVMTTFLLTRDYDEWKDMWASVPSFHFNPAVPHPDKPAPPAVEQGKDYFVVDGTYAKHNA